MDGRRFVALQHVILKTRRTTIAALAGCGVNFATLDSISGKKRKKKGKKKCKPQPADRTCAGKCGPVRNNCKKTINCEACLPACKGLAPTVNLQAVIDAAAPGATIALCPGTWYLPRQIRITKDLTLIGAGSDLTFLDGGDSVPVMRITMDSELPPEASLTPTVIIQGVTIRRGYANPQWYFTGGGGIDNEFGMTTLRGVVVTQCDAGSGAGIYNSDTLTLAAGTHVVGNKSINGSRGGGIFSMFGAVTLEAGSSVDRNTAAVGGGIYIYALSTVTLESGSSVSGNIATDGLGGGGIYLAESTSTLMMEPGSTVAGNSATATYPTGSPGGGIAVEKGSVTVQTGSSVTGNTATGQGGGIANNTGTVTLEPGSNIAGNLPDNCDPDIESCS